ncbi:PGRS family protein [Sorangium sp. So ce341]|uniref:PGRS family protein n=1 Tax=Sorangium sp. So ce341 TaxID=3133302 RepID=UPI003F5D894A
MVEPGCEPSAEIGVGKDCGVFVAAAHEGKDNGAGTQDAPFTSLSQAIERAKQEKKPIYVCAEDEPFKESVIVPAGITIFGGLDCSTDWRRVSAKKTALEGTAGEVPLTIQAAGGSVRIEDIHVNAASIIVDEDDPDDENLGKSSIAAVADGGSITLVRCTLTAGDAAPGTERSSGRAQEGAPGNSGGDACSDDEVDGGKVQRNDCGIPMDDADDSFGGRGGDGGEFSGLAGAPGQPLDEPNMPNGGAGQVTTAETCSNGTPGGPGNSGDPGEGAAGMDSFGSLLRDGQIGYFGVAGRDGTPGTAAQGGGGGGGARGSSTACQGRHGFGGASGGSGGAGGCGGAGGKGGGPGGASIALVSVDAKLTLVDVTLKAGKGGNGGNGGPGQEGGPGGMGGNGGSNLDISSLKAGCDGGQGGKGGNGGRGGGGRGGHALGIAFIGLEPSLDKVTFISGKAGTGGRGDEAAGNGADGEAADTVDFANPPQSP